MIAFCVHEQKQQQKENLLTNAKIVIQGSEIRCDIKGMFNDSSVTLNFNTVKFSKAYRVRAK